MTLQLARNLFHLMRGASRRTTLDGLKKRGHRNVAVLDFRDVQALIDKAVENTLQRRGISFDREDLQDDVRHEFLSLMRERDALKNTVDALLKEKDELAVNKEHLEEAIERTTAEVETIQAAPEEQNEEISGLQVLMDKLRASLRTNLSEAGVSTAVIQRNIELVTLAFDEYQQLLLERARESNASRLDQLQRRIGKLKRKLSETEDMLVRAREAGAGPEGIESEDFVPGVQGSDANANMKKELLGEIFRLNVELREMLDRTEEPQGHQ